LISSLLYNILKLKEKSKEARKLSFIGTFDFPGEEIFTLIPPRSSFGYRARFIVMKALFRKLPRLGEKG